MNEEQLENMLADFAAKVFRAKRKEYATSGASWIDMASRDTAKYLIKLLRQMDAEGEKAEEANSPQKQGLEENKGEIGAGFEVPTVTPTYKVGQSEAKE